MLIHKYYCFHEISTLVYTFNLNSIGEYKGTNDIDYPHRHFFVYLAKSSSSPENLVHTFNLNSIREYKGTNDVDYPHRDIFLYWAKSSSAS